MITSVIRVKRRIDEDPAEALIVSCKRKKQTENLACENDVESIFSFAGTIASKHDPVPQQIKETIKKTELTTHAANLKHPPRRVEYTSELRQKKDRASRANRFRIICSRRALDIDALDSKKVAPDSPEEKDSNLKKRNSPGCGESKLNKDLDIARQAETSDQSSTDFKSSSKAGTLEVQTEKTLCPDTKLSTDKCDDSTLTEEDKVFCILDVENDQEDVMRETSKQSVSGITLNNIPMVSHRVMSPPENERDFVYDLYYAHERLDNLDPEAVFTVEALCEELINEDVEDFQDRDDFRDDSDDSNDESNWRNDYPDEDPHFFENENVDDYYAEDMVDTNFLHCGDDDDQLAYWMGTRCKVDEHSDDDENDYEEDGDKDCDNSSNEY
uniref:Probable RNA polymerase II nuclear localization protein SLC7A6OS n=1 Tax=Biomphalaria glabrata TaxID=6526 RepID=A0A2C9M7Y5_BIOGL